MGILLLMILASVSLGMVFLIIFVLSARKGQFDDDQSPAVRMLLDDQQPDEEEKSETKLSSADGSAKILL